VEPIVILGIEAADCALPGRLRSLGLPAFELVASAFNESVLVCGRKVWASIDIGRKVLLGAAMECGRWEEGERVLRTGSMRTAFSMHISCVYELKLMCHCQ